MVAAADGAVADDLRHVPQRRAEGGTPSGSLSIVRLPHRPALLLWFSIDLFVLGLDRLELFKLFRRQVLQPTIEQFGNVLARPR